MWTCLPHDTGVSLRVCVCVVCVCVCTYSSTLVGANYRTQTLNPSPQTPPPHPTSQTPHPNPKPIKTLQGAIKQEGMGVPPWYPSTPILSPSPDPTMTPNPRGRNSLRTSRASRFDSNAGVEHRRVEHRGLIRMPGVLFRLQRRQASTFAYTEGFDPQMLSPF